MAREYEQTDEQFEEGLARAVAEVAHVLGPEAAREVDAAARGDAPTFVPSGTQRVKLDRAFGKMGRGRR